MKQSYYVKNRRQHQGSELVMEVEMNTMLGNTLSIFIAGLFSHNRFRLHYDRKP